MFEFLLAKKRKIHPWCECARLGVDTYFVFTVT